MDILHKIALSKSGYKRFLSVFDKKSVNNCLYSSIKIKNKQKNLSLTLEEQLELTETAINITKTNLKKISIVSVTGKVNELNKLSNKSYLNEKFMYNKNIE